MMTTYNHTPIAVDGKSMVANDVTAPDQELDEAIGLHNLTAVAAPGVNDDSGDGYAAGKSTWFDTVTSIFYRLSDSTVAAAVWDEVVKGDDSRLNDARAPTAHKSSHQNGGGDEVNVTGLSGKLADKQPLEVQKAGAAIGTRPVFNLIEGTNITLTVTDNPGQDRVDVTWDVPSGVGNIGEQILINGGFDIWQDTEAYTAATSIANNDDTYTAAQWINLTDGADIVDISKETTSPPPGANAFHRMDWQTINKQAAILQPIHSSQAIPLRDKIVSLSLQAKTTAAAIGNVRIGILEWSGTANAITSDVVGTWAGSGTNPTLATNWTYANTPTNKTLTTGWQTFTADNVTLGSSFNNLAIFIWVDDTTIAVNDILDIATVKLEIGASSTDYVPPELTQDKSRAKAFYEKTYKNNVFPGISTEIGIYEFTGLAGNCAIGDFAILTPRYTVEKIATPSITLYDKVGNVGKCTLRNADTVTTNNIAASTSNLGPVSFTVVAQSTAITQRHIEVHYVADSRL